MAKSRRKAGGATARRFKIKKMGKGWAAPREPLGFRPPMRPPGSKKEKREADEAKAGG